MIIFNAFKHTINYNNKLYQYFSILIELHFETFLFICTKLLIFGFLFLCQIFLKAINHSKHNIKRVFANGCHLIFDFVSRCIMSVTPFTGVPNLTHGKRCILTYFEIDTFKKKYLPSPTNYKENFTFLRNMKSFLGSDNGFCYSLIQRKIIQTLNNHKDLGVLCKGPRTRNKNEQQSSRIYYLLRRVKNSFREYRLLQLLKLIN